MAFYRCPVCRYGFGRKYNDALRPGSLAAPTVTCPRCTSHLRIKPRIHALASLVVLIAIGMRLAHISMPQLDLPFAAVLYLLVAMALVIVMLGNSLEVVERADPRRLGYRAFDSGSNASL